MSTHHDADAQKLKHCLGRLLAAGEVDGTTDPSAAVQTLIRAHPEYGRRPVGPLRAAVREALAVASPLPEPQRQAAHALVPAHAPRSAGAAPEAELLLRAQGREERRGAAGAPGGRIVAAKTACVERTGSKTVK